MTLEISVCAIHTVPETAVSETPRCVVGTWPTFIYLSASLIKQCPFQSLNKTANFTQLAGNESIGGPVRTSTFFGRHLPVLVYKFNWLFCRLKIERKKIDWRYKDKMLETLSNEPYVLRQTIQDIFGWKCFSNLHLIFNSAVWKQTTLDAWSNITG